MIPQRLEAGHPLFRYRIVLIDHARFDGIEKTTDPLIRLGDSPVKFGQMLTASLGALLAAVDNAAEDSFQPLGLEQTIANVIGNQVVEFELLPVLWTRR